MANPQLDNGFLRLANELVEALMRTNLSAYQGRILWAIFRRTYGFNRKEDWLANSQLVEMTGIRKQHISRTIKELTGRNIVTKSGYRIAFNKDYTQWRELPSQVTYPNQVTKVTNSGFKSNLTRGTQKKKTKEYTSDILHLSDLLAQKILENNPKHRYLSNGRYPETIKTWAGDIDKLHRIDGQSIEDITKVINWSQADAFWKKNILSGATLRKQWDRLFIASSENKTSKKDSWQ